MKRTSETLLKTLPSALVKALQTTLPETPEPRHGEEIDSSKYKRLEAHKR